MAHFHSSVSLLLKACACLWILLGGVVNAFSAVMTTTKKSVPSCSGSARTTTALGPVARNGLRYEDIEVGTGRRVNKGDTILCYYSGSYKKKSGGGPFAMDEKVVFDETKPGEPVEFLVGQGQLIPGMDMGIPGSIDFDIPPMNIGGDRRLIVPSALAYGAAGVGSSIPPNQDLEFQIAVLSAEARRGVSMEYRLKGYAAVLVFATVVLSAAFFLLH
jgi:FKBP-type peptidyl-prolyl cis-trans isomerase FkpA